MPAEALPLIYSAQRLKSPLSRLFEDLTNKFGMVKDNATIITNILNLTKSPTNLLSMLENKHNTLNSITPK